LFAKDENMDTKVLGLHWHPLGDFLSCELRIEHSIVFTKRGVLSLIARFFDPLGLFAPCIFLAKHIMQRTWVASCTRDGPLPPDIHTEWAQFVAELPELSSVHVPRFCNTPPVTACLLFGFCDASLKAYAAVAYLNVLDAERESSVFLVGTKTKLAPIKSPQLSRRMSRVKATLGERVTIVNTFAWTDSMVVLSWLTAPNEVFKQYVSNRVHLIQMTLPGCHWRYVPSSSNPAYCASRGLMLSELLRHELYWLGPRLIYDVPDEWGNDVDRIPRSELPEVQIVSSAPRVDEATLEWFDRFLGYDRMLRVVSSMYRSIIACRGQRPDSSVLVFLRKSELDNATRKLAIASQQVHFATLLHELSTGNHVSFTPIARLAPFIDPDRLIRVGDRLRQCFSTWEPWLYDRGALKYLFYLKYFRLFS